MTPWLDIGDQSAIAAARRLARAAARDAGCTVTQQEEVAIVATEATTNALRHGGGGRLLVARMGQEGKSAVALVVADNGPGIRDFGRMSIDGQSSVGSAGLGLGSMERLADRFHLWTEPGRGTVIACEFREEERHPRDIPVDVAGLVVCHPAETECGDAWANLYTPLGLDVIMCDGLGHGAHAAAGAKEVIDAYRTARGTPAERLDQVSQRLMRNRGAVAAALSFRRQQRALLFGGIGNISTLHIRDGALKRFPVKDGRLGGPPVRAYCEETRLAPGDLIICHSDGLATVRIDDFPDGLFHRSPLLIAAVLLHRNFRGRDDAGIVVARARGAR